MILSPVRNQEFKNYLDFILKFLLIVTLLVPLIVTESTFFPYVTGKAIYARTLIQISFLVWIIRLITAEKIYLSFSWLVFFAVGLTAVSILTSLFGVSFTHSLWSNYERMQGLIDMIHWSAFLLMTVSTFNISEFLRLVLPANFIIITLVAVLGIFQYYGVFLSLNFLEYSGQNLRIDSTLGNPTYLGSVCGINIFIGLLLICSKFIEKPSSEATQTRAIRRRVSQTTSSFATSMSYLPHLLIITTIFINLYALFLSGTRASILAILISFLTTALLCGFYKPNFMMARKLIVAGIFALLILLTAFFGYKESTVVSSFTKLHPTLDRFSGLSLYESSVAGRYETWKTGLKSFSDKPLLGWGTDNFMTAWAMNHDGSSQSDERFDQAHNKAVEVLVTNGLIGFLMYAGLWITIALFASNIYRGKYSNRQIWPVFLFGALLVYFLQSLALFDTQPIQAQFIVLLSCLVVLAHNLIHSQASTQRHTNLSFNSNKNLFRLAKFGVCLSLIPLAIYLINFTAIRPYKSAQAVKLAQNESFDWNKKTELYEKSMTTAPALATYPYIYMVNDLVASDTVINYSDLDTVKRVVDTWSTKILDEDPENWRVLFTTARFHQYYFLKTNNRDSIKIASVIIEKLKTSAPALPETNNVIEAQELININPN